MAIKAFAVDVDGTITENGGRLNLDAVLTLRRLEKHGYRIILVSGRSAWEVFALAIYLGTTRVAVGENGAVVAISPVDMAILADNSYSVMAYELLSQKIDCVKLRRVFPRLAEVTLERTFDIKIGRQILKESGLPVYISDSKYAYHIIHNDVNKAKGMRIALQYLHLGFNETVAIGDSEAEILTLI